MYPSTTYQQPSYYQTAQMHSTKETSMRDLENYLSELSNDITEMIGEASPEEKQLLQNKVAALANKLASLK